MRRTLFSTVSASRRNTPPSQSIPSPASPAPSLKTGGADNNEYTFKDFLDVKKIAKGPFLLLLTLPVRCLPGIFAQFGII